MPRRWRRSPFWPMRWPWDLPLHRLAAGARALSTDGCAAPVRLPSSSALCCRARRSAHFGLDSIVWLQAFLLGMAAIAAILVPELMHHPHTAEAVSAPAGGVLILLRLPLFRNLVLVAALILGSHSMHDAFAVIRWSASGISPSTASLLWSESVAAEVLVFFVIGPTLVTQLTPAG